MVELMVVVAILGITAALTVRGLTRDRVGEDARKVAAMMSTAYRTATGGGPVRTDVSAASGLKWRAYIEFSESSGQNIVAVYQLVEHTSDTGFDAVLVSSEILSPDTIVYSVSSTPAIDPGTSTVTASNLSTSTVVDKYYFPDGTADAMTVFLKHRTNAAATHYRVLGMGLNPVPQTFQDW